MSENNFNRNYGNNRDYNDNYYDDDSRNINEKNNYTSVDDNGYEDIYSDSGSNRRQPVRKKEKRSSKGKKVFKIILSVILILILGFGVYAALVVFRINYSGDNPDTESIEAQVGSLKSNPDVKNIMIFGADNHKDGENGRSDSMILMSIDKKHKTLKQTSFLRDLYITIPGYGENRLNASYSYGGPSLAVETIEYNFGIKIDSYAVVDFSSFTSIIDALGGIDLELTADEIDYINWQCWKNKQVQTRHELDVNDYTFETNDDGDSTAKVHLNGRQALWYARDRDSAGSDFDRTSRQRTVINTVISQMKSSNPITLMRVVYEVAPMITTNMSALDVTSLCVKMISYLNYERKELRVPANDNYSNTTTEDGAEVLTINDMDSEKQRLYNFIFEE